MELWERNNIGVLCEIEGWGQINWEILDVEWCIKLVKYRGWKGIEVGDGGVNKISWYELCSLKWCRNWITQNWVSTMEWIR